jgi:multidrug efflux pump subunit AcrB
MVSDSMGLKKYPSFQIIIIFALLFVCGASVIHLLNIQLNPSSHTSSFSISFSWPNADARVVEQEVCSKIEAICASVQGVKEISSTSRNGGGSIYISLDKKADIDAIRFEVSTLIRQIWSKLPSGVSYPQLNMNRADGREETPLLSYTLNAQESAFVIQKYVDEVIQPALSHIPGIYKTLVYGASPMEWQIVYDASKLELYGITLPELENAVTLNLRKENVGIGNLRKDFNQETAPLRQAQDYQIPRNNRNDNVGFIESIPLVLTTKNYENLESIPVKKKGARIIQIGDVARVYHREAEPISYFRINGLNTINIVVYAAKGVNNLRLCQTVKERIETISNVLPNGYQLIQGYDSTEYIHLVLRNISIRALFTFLILVLFILAVTRNAKHAVLVLVMLVVNLSIAAIFYYIFRIELHLYALAGITVSMGLTTDNIIIMSDHLRTQGNRLAWLAVLAGTLCTVSALTVIFFMEEKVKANLVDFALVIVINQAVSLLTALFLIPALMDTMKLVKNQLVKSGGNRSGMINILPWKVKQTIGFSGKGRHLRVRFTHSYQNLYLLLKKRKTIPIAIFVLGFGLPIFMLPDKWNGENWYNRIYNSTIGSSAYKEKIRPWADRIFGGTLRLFVEHVYHGSYFNSPEETTININASLPNGTTLEQMNVLVRGMEKYLQQFTEIKTFQSIISTNWASINVYFKQEYQKTSFPFELKRRVISKALELGGGSWSVYGFGDGFSNDTHQGAGSYLIETYGYNYDQLHSLAEKLKERLMQNPRIKEIFILPQRVWYRPDNMEFAVRVDNVRSILSGITPYDIYNSLARQAINNTASTTINYNNGIEDIKFISKQSGSMDVWNLERIPLKKDTVDYKFKTLSKIEKQTIASTICKVNQQYRLCLQFEYIGVSKFADKFIKHTLADFQPHLPIGYSTQYNQDYWYWSSQAKKQYWLLGLIIVIVFFICAVLFESLIQPFAVILTIPIAYMGVFLTFFLFDLNFDQGGFAAFVLLSGITVNASIYILNDYNSLMRHRREKISPVRLYFKAFAYKIFPILLTIISTVLGFIPFLAGERQPFWFSLAAGTIGGLLFSLIGIILYLPLFLRIGKDY